MATMNEKKLAGAVVSLVMVLSYEVIVTNWEQTYYCATEDSILECWRLSESKRSCYYDKLHLGKRDLCTDGSWEPIEEYMERPERIQEFIIPSRDGDWVCYTEGGIVTAYTPCYQGDAKGYVFEKI